MTRPWPFSFAEKISHKESNEIGETCTRRKKSTVRVGRHMGTLRVTPSWSLLGGIWSKFPLASHFDLPGSESVFGIPRDPPMCLHISVKMDSTAEAYESSKELSSQEGLLNVKNEKCVVSYLYIGRAQPSLFVLLIDILEFLSTGNKLLIAHPGWGWGGLPPASSPV